MVRGFCSIAVGAGFGLGAAAGTLRFRPGAGTEAQLTGWLADEVLRPMIDRRGIVGAHLLKPAPPPPMTREQALRGTDSPMPWLILVTGYDRVAVEAAVDGRLSARLSERGASDLEPGHYALHYTADRDEVARSGGLPVLTAPGRAGR
jgi:hypothetical protein